MAATIILACLMALGDVPQAPVDATDLARRVDAHLARRIEVEHARVADRADDDEFLRRASLDLIGRIPALDEVRAFLADARADKRQRLIDTLLSSKEHSRHYARVWRALLLPEAEVEPQLRYFEPGLEAWLAGERAANVGFDRQVRALIAVPIAGDGGPPEVVLRDLRRPNPLAFIAAKNAEPAKVASAAVRLFLGIRLECAQCHDHPFDNWTQQQFWNQAAFFAGIERRGRGVFAPLVEVTARRTITLMDSTETVAPEFLDETAPQLPDAQSARLELARWMTSKQNPYFARAVVNRVWAQLFGTGLVEPVDDFRPSNPASHPELLAELADAFVAMEYDVTGLYRALCRTAAYERTSRQSDASQSRAELYARMPVRPMSGEQFFDSLAAAIGYQSLADRSPGEPDRDHVRQAVIALYVGNGSADPQTSVAQALALMNGEVTAGATRAATSARLKQILDEFPDVRERQIESLYLRTLSRYPTADEQQTLREFYGRGDNAQRRLGDIFWALLNSAEFSWNH